MSSPWPVLLFGLPTITACLPAGALPIESRNNACAAATAGAIDLVNTAGLSGAYMDGDWRPPVEMLEDLTDSEWRPWSTTPPQALLVRYADTTPTSALSLCPSVPVALDAAGLKQATAGEVDDRAAAVKPLILDLPVLNEAGDEALMRVAVLPRRGMGGFSGVIWLRRDQRGWRVRETKLTAIYD